MSHGVEPKTGKAKVVDTVAYKGLVPGETYIAVGTLMDKGTGEPFLDKDGNEVTARTFIVSRKLGPCGWGA